MKTESWLKIAGVVVVYATVVFGVTKIQQTGITIRNTGTIAGGVQNSISVTGEGKVTATPDIVNVSVGVSELAKTTSEAQTQANEKLNQILAILKTNGVPDKNVQTSQLSFREEYDWKDGERKTRGQRVEQTLSVEVPEIDKNQERVVAILDALGQIDGITLNAVTFDIKDKTEFFSQAREQAFEKAEQKARELAALGGVTLEKPITISESQINFSPMPYLRNMAVMDMAEGAGGGSSLPAGELDVTATVNVVWGIR